METLSSRKQTDFTPLLRLAKKGGRAIPRHVGILVVPTGDPAAPFVGLVAADNKPIVRASLDQAGAAAFAAEAMLRVNETMPATHQQVMVDLGLAATGIIVPTPPTPPKDEDLVALMAKVFEYQRKLLQQLAAGRPIDRPAPGKVKLRGLAEISVRAKAQVRAKAPVRGKTAARAKRVR